MSEPIMITAEQIARELAWRLSNSNAEVCVDADEVVVDVAYDTDRAGNVIGLFVNAWDGNSRWMQRFKLTVEAGTDTPDGAQS